MVRSFFEAPQVIYANRALQSDPGAPEVRSGDAYRPQGAARWRWGRSPHATGGEMGGSPEGGSGAAGMNAQDVLHAWRDFECTFFAGALLAPKCRFGVSWCVSAIAWRRRRKKLEITPALVMRRMTKVSRLSLLAFLRRLSARVSARGLPGQRHPAALGQSRPQVSDPCPNWAVFRMMHGERGRARLADLGAARRRALAAVLLPLAPGARHGRQCSTCCRSGSTWRRRSTPRLAERAADRFDLPRVPAARRGEARIPKAATQVIGAVANVLNIAWIERGAAGAGAHHLSAQ